MQCIMHTTTTWYHVRVVVLMPVQEHTRSMDYAYHHHGHVLYRTLDRCGIALRYSSHGDEVTAVSCNRTPTAIHDIVYATVRSPVCIYHSQGVDTHAVLHDVHGG